MNAPDDMWITPDGKLLERRGDVWVGEPVEVGTARITSTWTGACVGRVFVVPRYPTTCPATEGIEAYRRTTRHQVGMLRADLRRAGLAIGASLLPLIEKLRALTERRDS